MVAVTVASGHVHTVTLTQSLVHMYQGLNIHDFSSSERIFVILEYFDDPSPSPEYNRIVVVGDWLSCCKHLQAGLQHCTYTT